MKKLFAILVLFVTVACATPIPTPTGAPPSALPTKVPASSSVASSVSAPATATTKPSAPSSSTTSSVASSIAPTAVPTTAAKPGIAVQNVQEQKQADGNIRTTANVTAANNLGLGQIDLSYPETMLLGESRTIRLKLSSAQQLVSMTPVAVPAKTPDLPNFVYKFGGNIDLYPQMIAELRAIKFDIKPTGAQRRNVDPTKEVVWDWVVSPTVAEHQELSLELSIPAVVGGVATDLSTDVIKNLVFTIDVQASQQSLLTRSTDSIVSNAGGIIAALIGLIGTVIGIIYKIQSDKSKTPRSSKK